MPAGRTNLSYHNSKRLQSLLMGILLRKGTPQGFSARGTLDATSGERVSICQKAGAPASNGSGDQPCGIGDICIDSTNNDIYLCTAYASSTSFTWTKLYS